jgi:Dockerin type I domain
MPTPTHSPTHSPTATPHATPTPTASPSGIRKQGDVNCDGVVDEGDVRFLIKFSAELNDGTTPGACPDVGVNEAISGHKWGDVNCDGFVNALDALYVLVFKVQLHTLPSPPQNCFPIGSVIT